jgi:hypothetical protein
MMNPTADMQAIPTPRTDREKTAALRRHLFRQLMLELVVPLAGYYALRAMGASQWLALAMGSLLVVPWIVFGMVRNRRLDGMAMFTLTLMLAGAVMSLVTGDPRVLLVRDSWLGGLVGLWMLGSVPTQRPVMRMAARAIVVVKIGEAGAATWAARWDSDAAFRKHLRVLTAVWGAGFALDAGVRVLLAYTLPLDSVPAVSSAQWLVVLAGLIAFHIRYVGRNGLKV